MRKTNQWLALAGAALLLTACGEESSEKAVGTEKEKQVVHYTAPTEMATMDTVLMTDINSSNYSGHTIVGLLKINEKGEPVPAIAVDMGTVSDDGLTYTFKLRDDATWSNGDPVTANDFVFAWQRLVDPATGASYAYLAENIENAPEIMTGDKSPSELGIKALSDYELQITLTQPTPYFNSLLAFSPFLPQNEAFVEEQGTQYGTTSEAILANGPFVMEDWDGTGLTWKLVKNEEYYDADEVHINEIDVQVLKETSTAVNLFESGEVDNAQLTGEMAKVYKDDPNAVIHEKARTSYIDFNYENEQLQNQNLRKAISLVIDRKELVDSVIGDGSNDIYGFMPQNFATNPETGKDFTEEATDYFDYDVEQAKDLWEKAKDELGTDTLTLSFVGDDDEKSKKISEYVQGQIQNNLDGISVQLRNVPKKNRLEFANKNEFDLLLTGWGADFRDPVNFMDLLYSTSAYNEGGYANEEFDALLEKAKSEDANNEEARWQDMIEAHDIAMEETAVLPLYQEAEVQLRNPALKGINLQPVGNEFDLSNAYLE
ncbi:peptide ABC transporter substrate-binding protein [Pisciglobus halotolerans]|uniref:Oligopeptide transport system substrate-binding protein n=1 Tax=Pisciglobus halotolerans TaxID=745365 RepID=A0A1I3D4P8_9LACT|nr:peptide ABC transporter substrate-binding protein [Pisciglobus halotolerans]SFH81519.1 oligopeptide transport system substrate-binding protein [Pisciglobus halotolerans]